MELRIRRYNDGTLDFAGTVADTIDTAGIEEVFSPPQFLEVLRTSPEVAREGSCNLRRVTKYLSSWSSHIGGYKLIEVGNPVLPDEQRAFALYTDERFRALTASGRLS